MPKIHVLPPQIAELIAAGEVIDRPASIVKELVENSLDAGATRITVEIKNGGIALIRVTDNGCGMAREDVANAFLRHATSKVQSAHDLDAIGTLGFRGEALASIVAVSRVCVTTCTADSPLGCTYTIEGGDEGTFADAGCPVGTVFEIRDVFYNTPARMKFLKKDSTEGNAIATLLDRLALANPGVSFTLIREGKRTLHTPGDGNLLTAIRMVCGADFAAQMIPVSGGSRSVTVQGYISKPATSRTTRTMQIFFVNTRYVRSRTCAAALEDTYKNRLMVGRFPACVLNITVDTAQVDVNVHPAKLEVRFSSEHDIYDAVSAACAEALHASERHAAAPQKHLNIMSLDDFDYSAQQTRISYKPAGSGISPAAPLQTTVPRPLPKMSPNMGSGMETPTVPQRHETLSPEEAARPAVPEHAQAHVPGRVSMSGFSTVPAASRPAFNRAPAADINIEVTPRREVTPPPQDPLCEQEVSEYRIVGEIFDTYILVQQGESFHIIDKHAAHERYNYNRLRHLGEENEQRQVLLSPQAVALPREEYAILLEHPEALEAVGITAEDFGEGTLLVREIPMLLDGCDLHDVLSEMAGKLMENRRSITPSVIDELLYSVSCRASVMAGKCSSMPEMAALVKMVLCEDGVRFCPHGRPTLVTMSRRDVEKLFGRLG